MIFCKQNYKSIFLSIKKCKNEKRQAQRTEYENFLISKPMIYYYWAPKKMDKAIILCLASPKWIQKNLTNDGNNWTGSCCAVLFLA